VIAGGLYDRHAIGGGDSVMLSAWEGRDNLPRSLQHWANLSYDQVRGSLACVRGDVVHLYHGSRQNRQYVERYKIFHDHAYDPESDVEIDGESGLLQWSAAARERKPDLIRRVAEYFERRREDE
jgi:hypothetical protein